MKQPKKLILEQKKNCVCLSPEPEKLDAGEGHGDLSENCT